MTLQLCTALCMFLFHEDGNVFPSDHSYVVYNHMKHRPIAALPPRCSPSSRVRAKALHHMNKEAEERGGSRQAQRKLADKLNGRKWLQACTPLNIPVSLLGSDGRQC